jgi:hypothetical protein
MQKKTEMRNFRDRLITLDPMTELLQRSRDSFRGASVREFLSELKKRGFILRLDSKVYGEIWFVSHAGPLRPSLGSKKKSALEEAAEFLREELAEGPVPSKELLKKAKAEGISEKTLRRAKSLLGVESKMQGRERWVWMLPKEN